MSDIANVISESVERQLEPLFQNISDAITDIVVNPDGNTFRYSSSAPPERCPATVGPGTIERIAPMLASLSGQTAGEDFPCLSCTLPKRKFRIEVLLPPAVEKACLAVRIPSRKTMTLEALASLGMLSRKEAEILAEMVRAKRNIMISGETGTGKTTLLNALLNTMRADERLIIIEDFTREIFAGGENVVNITADKTRFSGRMAVMSAMRMNPDRIIYGESRSGDSALETLKAWRTGHGGGLSTIHAPSADGVKGRLRDLLAEVCSGDMSELIDSTVDVAVHISFSNGIRKVAEIKNFKGA